MNFGEKDSEMERNSRREEGEEEEGKEFSEFCERRKKGSRFYERLKRCTGTRPRFCVSLLNERSLRVNNFFFSCLFLVTKHENVGFQPFTSITHLGERIEIF